MDRRTNPYAPGAGTPPPELVGRDELIEDADVALDRLRNGLAAKSQLMVGLRGVGKTVLLNRMLMDATDRGFECVLIEAPEDRSLPGVLAGPLNSALIRVSRSAAARDMAELGSGPHRSGAIAQVLGRPVQRVAPTRARLVKKGMIYGPAHGDTAFTVPLFDRYLKRVMG